MIAQLRRGASRLFAIALVTSGGAGLALLAPTAPAHADPSFTLSEVGVGSDTIQAVLDAYSGAEPYPGSVDSLGNPVHAVFYTPLQSQDDSGNTTISSFDAIPAGGSASAPGCIVTTLNGSSFDRPNGSGNGVKALEDSITSTNWEAATASSCTKAPVSVVGQINFARSSSGPSGTGTQLTWIPFARDAVSYAFYGTTGAGHSSTGIASLTHSQLNQLYTSSTGKLDLNGGASGSGITVEACEPQDGSGTRKFFDNAIGTDQTHTDTASNAVSCNGTANGVEENGGDKFFTFASALPANTYAVIPFSVGSWISQANGAALDVSSNARSHGVDLGNLDSISVSPDSTTKPYDGSPGNEAPSQSFYANTTFGRDVYIVVPTAKISGGAADSALQELFVGTSSAICQGPATTAGTAQNTARKFGFDQQLPSGQTCGMTTLTGSATPGQGT